MGSSSTFSSMKEPSTNHVATNKDQPSASDNRLVTVLRFTLLALLLIATSVAAVGVYLYTRNEEEDNFHTAYAESAYKVVESFVEAVGQNLAAVDSLAVSLTSYANNPNIVNNTGFPFVTLPDFEVRGALLRVQAGAAVVHWLPLVTNERRAEWEQYARDNRFHIDEAFARDQSFRQEQDATFGLDNTRRRSLEEEEEENQRTETILDDGTGYHPRIWSTGAIDPRGDEPEGTGPYLVVWQRSPINGAKQNTLNINFAKTKPLSGVLDVLLKDRKAVMNRAITPLPQFVENLEKNLELGQYRHDIQRYVMDPLTFLAYPVFDSFDEKTKQVAGALAVNIYWKELFSNLLPASARGIICVMDNSYNQSFSYRIDGAEATFLGMQDAHDTKYNNMEYSEDINAYLQNRATPKNIAYTTVGLNENHGKYRIRVYPSSDTESIYTSSQPAIFTVVVVCIFAFTSLLFVIYSCLVERRHQSMAASVIANAEKAATAERELNEFVAHEVRNPLSAALSAATFVSSAINTPNALLDDKVRTEASEDMDVIASSLRFINDFLRACLDIHRAELHLLELSEVSTDVRRDVFEPVKVMLRDREARYEMRIECPKRLVVNTDRLRLKQVVLNLVRNASKFVDKGYICMRAEVVDGLVCLYVEDSGPGIPVSKRGTLFCKYQRSLDSLSQGTGVGLCLSKTLMVNMGGDLTLDDSYRSEIEGRDGARFIISLRTRPLEDMSEEELKGSMRQSHRQSIRNSSMISVLSNSQLPTHSEHAEDVLTATVMPAGGLPAHLSVLFVDDDRILRRLFTRSVRTLAPEWDIREAASGENALEMCEAEHFDLIFMDMYMSSVDKQLTGTETVRQMRSRSVNSIICGLSANDLLEAFLSAGADAFLLKPLPAAKPELKRVLEDILHASTKALPATTPATLSNTS